MKMLSWGKLLFDKDKLFLLIAIIYLASLFGILSHCHLDDESHLDVVTIMALRDTGKFWPITEWGYGPIWPYMGYLYSNFFHFNILGLRYIVVLSVVLSGIAIYKTARFFCSPIFAFLGVIITYVYIRFPTPQLSWYVVQAIFTWSIYFLIKYIYSNYSVNLYWAGIFAGLAFCCKPYPIIGVLLGLIFLYLLGESFFMSKYSMKRSISSAFKFILPCLGLVVGICLAMVFLLNYKTNDLMREFIFPYDLVKYIFLLERENPNSNAIFYDIKDLLLRIHQAIILFTLLIITRKNLNQNIKRAASFIGLINLSYIVRRAYVYWNVMYAMAFLIIAIQLIPAIINLKFSRIKAQVLKNYKFLPLQIQKNFKNLIALILIFYFLNITAHRDPGSTYKQIIRKDLTMATIWPLEGIYLEKWLVDTFDKFGTELRERYGSNKRIGFISNRYLQMIPIMYGLTNTFPGQIHLYGNMALMSYDAFISSKFTDPDNLNYKNRIKVISKIEETKTDVLVFPLLDLGFEQYSLDDADPLHRYIKLNFVKLKSLYGFPGVSLSNSSFNLIVFERKEY